MDILNVSVHAEYVNERVDYLDKGYHYAVLLNKTSVAAGCSTADGFGGPGALGVSGEASDGRIVYAFMHELGHSLGLTSDTFGGIDSRRTAYREYPSTMNYRSPRGRLTYSDGTSSSREFDDWEHIGEQLPAVITADELEAEP